MSSADGWRLHDDNDDTGVAESLQTSEETEFERVEAKLVVPKIVIYRPSRAGGENINWFAAELTATVSVVERYRALVASLSFFSKNPSDAVKYSINIAQQHLIGVSFIAARAYADKISFTQFLRVRSEMFTKLCANSWQFFSGKNKNRALQDLSFLIAEPPTSEEQLFALAKQQDAKGAGYRLKDVSSLGELADTPETTAKKTKSKASTVEPLVLNLLNWFARTRQAYIGREALNKVQDKDIKTACKTALRQASLYVRYFASAIREASDPTQAQQTFLLLDELTDVTHKLSDDVYPLKGKPEPTTGGYSSGGPSSYPAYSKEGVSFKKDSEWVGQVSPGYGSATEYGKLALKREGDPAFGDLPLDLSEGAKYQQSPEEVGEEKILY